MPMQQTMPISQPQPVMNGNAYQAPNSPQPAYTVPQGQPQYNNAPVYGGSLEEEYMTEPPLQTNGGYAAHREGEYDSYPDFPGYPNNNMFNHQNA
jgi:hypothetical protein